MDATDSDTLYLQGDNNDTVQSASGETWQLTGRANFDNAPDMYIYQADNSGSTVSIYVQTDLLQNGLDQTSIGTEGDDTFKVKDTTFGHLDAGSGFDRLVFLQDGTIDLANLAAGNTLANLEVVDSTNGTANSLTMDADFVAQTHPSNTLYVMGDSTDSLALSGWTPGGSTPISANLTWDSYTSTASGGELVTVYADSQVNTTT